MNILYIGPYKDIEYKDICNNHILSLNYKYKLQILPIYLSNNQIEISNNLFEIEKQAKSQKTEYSAVIQYAPAEYLFPFNRSIAKKSICIPIINYPISSNKNIDNFDKILFDSKYDSDLALKELPNKSKKIKLFSYDLSYKKDISEINLNYLNSEYKFYMFVNDNNIEAMNNIILPIASSFARIKNCCLLIISSSKQISEKISTYINILSEKIMYIKNRIKIIQEPLPDKDNKFIMNIHKTCDCLIDIRFSSNCSFHSFLAKEFNNSVINNENFDIIYESYKIDNNEINYAPHPIIRNNILLEKIKTIAKTKPIYRQNNIPTLDQII